MEVMRINQSEVVEIINNNRDVIERHDIFISAFNEMFVLQEAINNQVTNFMNMQVIFNTMLLGLVIYCFILIKSKS